MALIENHFSFLWWTWSASIVLTSVLQKTAMTQIYLHNRGLASEILGNREAVWKVRGFGWVTIRDLAAWNRLSKAILKRSDPKIITKTFWALYLVTYGYLIVGMVFIVLYFTMDMIV